jgi:hypothetical protein
MKRTLIAVIGLGGVIGLGYVLLGGSTYEAENTPQTLATSTSAVVAEPTAAELLETATQEMIAEAIAASSLEIEMAKEQAATAVELQMEREIEREVRASIKADNDARITEIDKETGAY